MHVLCLGGTIPTSFSQMEDLIDLRLYNKVLGQRDVIIELSVSLYFDKLLKGGDLSKGSRKVRDDWCVVRLRH